jgi:hypothetical protein
MNDVHVSRVAAAAVLAGQPDEKFDGAAGFRGL